MTKCKVYIGISQSPNISTKSRNLESSLESFMILPLSFSSCKRSNHTMEHLAVQKETGGPSSAADSTTDIEKTSSLNINRDEEQVDEAPAPQYERPISNWQWALVCLGLFLGAMLYGEFLHCPLIILPANKNFRTRYYYRSRRPRTNS